MELLLFVLLVGGGIVYFFRNQIFGATSDQDEPSPHQTTRDEERAKQIEALKAAVPPSLPERMRATIQMNKYKLGRRERSRIKHLVGQDSFRYAEVGEDTRFSVDMILEASEAERALIKQNELDDIVLEESAAYTEDGIYDAKRRHEEEIEAETDPYRREVVKSVTQQVLAGMKQERSKTRLGDLFVTPFSRSFDSPHEAKEYADKLKTKLLPTVRHILDGYVAQKRTETLEF